MYVPLDPLFVKRSIRETRSSSIYSVGKEGLESDETGGVSGSPSPSPWTEHPQAQAPAHENRSECVLEMTARRLMCLRDVHVQRDTHVRPLERPQPWILSPSTLDARVNHYFAGQHSTARRAPAVKHHDHSASQAHPCCSNTPDQGRQAGRRVLSTSCRHAN